MDQQLKDAVDNLYVVFAEAIQAVPELIHGGDLSAAEVALFQTKPVRQLTKAELFDFMSNVFDFECPTDLKHFWPRLCEASAAGELMSSFDFIIVFRKLRLADWRHWSDEEQTATEYFAMRLWINVLNFYPFDSPAAHYEQAIEAEKCLEALAESIDDLSPYLVVWEMQTSVEALRNLAYLANECMFGFENKIVIGSDV